MSARYVLQMTSQPLATARAANMALRPDMAEQFAGEQGTIPPGPVWTLLRDGEVLGMGGLEPKGASRSLGWLLVAEGLTPRDWAMGRRAMREALDFAARRAVRRVQALVEARRPEACALLLALGFVATDRDGDNIIMTRELV